MRGRIPFFSPNRFPLNPRRQAFEARIKQAFALFDSGEYLQSAQLFEELGNIAEAHNGPRAPRFYMEGGQGYLYARHIPEGMALLEKGRLLFIVSGRPETAARLCFRIKDELAELGLNEQANLVADWSAEHSLHAETQLSQLKLPLKCPSCGGPVIANDLIWLDAFTAECDYCGNPMRADANP